jgi:hypothetical protein
MNINTTCVLLYDFAVFLRILIDIKSDFDSSQFFKTTILNKNAAYIVKNLFGL